MRHILQLILFLFSGVLFGQQKYIESDSIIEWNLNKKLNWSDFEGKPNSEVYGAAMTSYKIEVFPSDVMVDENDKIQDYQNLSVRANFYKNYSWAIERNIELLKHEQLHFDIAELFARKIRKNFRGLQEKKEARFSVYLESYKALWKECRLFQKRYDSDTRHGLENAKNKTWSDRVRSDLEMLKAFKIEPFAK